MEILFDSESEVESQSDRIAPHFRCRIGESESGNVDFHQTTDFQAFALVLGFKAYFLPAKSVAKVLSWPSERLARLPDQKRRTLFLASHQGRSLVVLDLQAALIGPRDLPASGFVLCSVHDPGFGLWIDRLGELSEVSRDRFDRPAEGDFWFEGEDEVGASLIRPQVLLGSRILEHLC